MKKTILAIVASVAAMSTAQAQMISKPYIGLGVTSTNHQLKGLSTFGSADRKAAGKIFAGADITPALGVEIGHSESRDDFGVATTNVAGTAETDSRRTYLAAKGTTHINDKFSVFGKLGMVHTKDKINTNLAGLSRSESDNGVYAALGGQYNINEKVALSLEYERNGKKRDFGAKPDAVTVAARYNF